MASCVCGSVAAKNWTGSGRNSEPAGAERVVSRLQAAGSASHDGNWPQSRPERGRASNGACCCRVTCFPTLLRLYHNATCAGRRRHVACVSPGWEQMWRRRGSAEEVKGSFLWS